jgi:hypothetical protein
MSNISTGEQNTLKSIPLMRIFVGRKEHILREKKINFSAATIIMLRRKLTSMLGSILITFGST